MKKLVTAITTAAASFATLMSAQAADLPVRPAYQPPVVAVQQVYNWTGFYVGVNGGYGWGQQDPFNIITDRFDSLSTGISGGVFGGTLGAQIQAAHVVMGLEADLDWANIKGSTTAVPTIAGIPFPGAMVNASTNIDWESTVRFRVGYANENWLFYGTGGLALLGAKTNLTRPVSGGAVCAGILVNCSGTNRQISVGARRRPRIRIYAEFEREN